MRATEKTYRYRIYPNKQQQEQIQKTFGCCRFVYNQYLNMKIKKYTRRKEFFGFYDCCKDLTKMKQRLQWLRNVDKFALQN